jgi:catechol 2,3-dioxygenase-like lactoylglutathione lyase family enzyme
VASGGVTEFQDLCLDVTDPERMAAFWGPLLGLRRDPERPERLVDGVEEHTLWLNVVPEPRTVKQRVHLDVHVAEVSDVVDLGGTVLADRRRWTEMADPEGGELCAFVRDAGALPDYRLYEVVVDSADPAAIGTWWADRFGVSVGHEPDGGDGEFSWLEGPPGPPFEMIFAKVPEPKTVKNRLHWDVRGNVEELLDAGARLLRRPDDDISWHVLADPEGNEFCVFPPR